MARQGDGPLPVRRWGWAAAAPRGTAGSRSTACSSGRSARWTARGPRRRSSSPSVPVPLRAWAPRRRCRAQRGDVPARKARAIFPLPPPSLRTVGGRCRPSCAPSGRSPAVVRRGRRRADGRPSRPSARLSSFRSTRSRTWMAAWPLGLAPGTAAVAVERVSSGGRAKLGPGARRAALRGGFAAFRPPGGDHGGHQGRRGSAAHRPGAVHNRTWRAYGVPLKMGGRGRERRLTVPTQVFCLELLMEFG